MSTAIRCHVDHCGKLVGEAEIANDELVVFAKMYAGPPPERPEDGATPFHGLAKLAHAGAMRRRSELGGALVGPVPLDGSEPLLPVRNGEIAFTCPRHGDVPLKVERVRHAARCGKPKISTNPG